MDTQLATGSEPKLTRRRRGVRLRGAGRRAASPAQASSLSGERSPLDVQPKSLDLHALAAQWQRALDANEFALRAAVDTLPASYLSRQRRELTQERQETAALLEMLLVREESRPLPWLSSGPVTKQMLGLTRRTRHVSSTSTASSPTAHFFTPPPGHRSSTSSCCGLTASTGWHFIPFDPDVDYRTYIEGRSRLEGIHSFLESRGIRLPEGRIDGPAGCGYRARAGEAQG